MILHTFGDSHSYYPWNSIKTKELIIKIHHIGPKTCAAFGLEKLNVLNIKNNFDVNEGDVVCFCFGEIDCRAHLCQTKNFKIHKILIDEIVSHYFEAIKVNVEQYKNLIVLVYNVVPVYKVDSRIILSEPTKANPYPFVGSNEERKEVTLYMNSKFKEYCEKYNYMFFDVYDKYCDEEGFLNLKFKTNDNTVHIGNGIYITEFLKIIL